MVFDYLYRRKGLSRCYIDTTIINMHDTTKVSAAKSLQLNVKAIYKAMASNIIPCSLRVGNHKDMTTKIIQSLCSFLGNKNPCIKGKTVFLSHHMMW